MSSSSRRRSGRRNPSPNAAAPVSEDEVRDFISKLQELIPSLKERNNERVAAEVVKEACSYIQKLNREVEELSDKLSQLLSDLGIDSADVELIQTILLH